MEEERRFEYLEHTADVYIEAYGVNLDEAFENAALATVEVMTDTNKIESKTLENIEVLAQDEYALLYNWLEELLILFDTEGLLFSKFKVSEISETEKGLKLKAKIWGEEFDPARHPQKVGVKAVTYHLMEIVKKPDSVLLRFILDI
ncbi:MAG: archease [Candidatus Bathyarchaeota archaeon]|jgi:SHS2 domain-containing protein